MNFSLYITRVNLVYGLFLKSTFPFASSHKFHPPPQLVGPSNRVPPIIRQGPANQTASPGATVQLHCRAIGGPAVQISWEKDGEGLQGDEARLTLMENGTLQITDTEVV